MRNKGVSAKTIGRLSAYRRALLDMGAKGTENVFSHELARVTGVTAAQLRRDIMAIGYSGNPRAGYEVSKLTQSIAALLDPEEPQNIAIIGIGNLGRAVMAYFKGRRPKMRFTAAFDVNPEKTGRVIHGCRCYHADDMPRIIADEGIKLAVIAVPAEEAQNTVDTLVTAGIKALVNFAPAPLRVPPDVYVVDMDMTTSLEKAAFFAFKQ